MEEAASSFDKFSVEMGDFEVRKTSKFDRMWKIEPGGSILQIPLIHGDTIYFGSLNFNVHAVDVSSGKLVWKFKTEGIIGESSPVYWNGNVYIGSFDHNLYCLDAATGRMKWKHKTQAEIYSSAFVAGGKVYIGSRDQFLYALDAKTGKLQWKFYTQDEIVSVPTVHDNKVLIGSFDKNLYCLDAGTGKLIWKFATQGEVHTMNPFLVHEGIVYFGSFDNYLRAVDLETGSLVWKFRTGIYGNAAIPVLHDNVLYHVDRDGHLFALTLDGKLLWKFTNREHLSIPVFYGDRILIGSEDFNLHCLSTKGKKLWSFKTEGPVFIKSAIKDGRAFFPSWDCHLYCLDIETTQLLWKFRTDGSPSYLPPPYEAFELKMKVPGSDIEETGRKAYELDLGGGGEEAGSFYKSRVTYQVSTQYREKGKYMVDSDEEAL